MYTLKQRDAYISLFATSPILILITALFAPDPIFYLKCIPAVFVGKKKKRKQKKIILLFKQKKTKINMNEKTKIWLIQFFCVCCIIVVVGSILAISLVVQVLANALGGIIQKPRKFDNQVWILHILWDHSFLIQNIPKIVTLWNCTYFEFFVCRCNHFCTSSFKIFAWLANRCYLEHRRGSKIFFCFFFRFFHVSVFSFISGTCKQFLSYLFRKDLGWSLGCRCFYLLETQNFPQQTIVCNSPNSSHFQGKQKKEMKNNTIFNKIWNQTISGSLLFHIICTSSTWIICNFFPDLWIFNCRTWILFATSCSCFVYLFFIECKF